MMTYLCTGINGVKKTGHDYNLQQLYMSGCRLHLACDEYSWDNGAQDSHKTTIPLPCNDCINV